MKSRAQGTRPADCESIRHFIEVSADYLELEATPAERIICQCPEQTAL